MTARLLLVLPLVLAAACARPPAAPAVPTPATRVQVVPVETSMRALPVRVPGVACRRAEAALAFKVGGIVREVSVRAGDAVAAGQLLASLDLVESDAQLAQARSALAKAQRDHERLLELRERSVVSQELAENAATALEVAQAAVRIAEFNRQHAVVTAPAAGRILKRLVEPNDMVAANKVALLFASEAEGWIARAGVPETEAARLRVGDPALITAFGQAAEAGVIAQIAEAADAATRTIEIEVRLASPPQALRSGTVVDLELQPADVPARPVVPVSALVEGEGKTASVFLTSSDGRSAQRRQVTVQAVHDGAAYLGGELPVAARVVVTGAEFLRDGAAIEIVP